MSFGTRKRFWKSATVVPAPDGFSVHLDGREIKTPAKAPLTLPTRAFAELVAAEWNAQSDKIDPESMPATRAANAAIDKVRPQFEEVAALLIAYGETDLLCYRAETPTALIMRQAAAWDPLLAWSATRFGVRWAVTTGIMPTPQPAETITCLGQHIRRFTPYQMAAFHDLVSMPGSLVIGLAATEKLAPPEVLWAASRIDEDWQIAQWGEDEEELIRCAKRRQSFLNAVEFFHAST